MLKKRKLSPLNRRSKGCHTPSGGCTPEGFLTKGDNNNVEDSWKVKPDSLIGEVDVILPNAGFVAKFISSKAWVFTICSTAISSIYPD